MFVSQLQILSHQSKIARKIELFVSMDSSLDLQHFRRLGYLSLDSNERSGFQVGARRRAPAGPPERLTPATVAPRRRRAS